MRARKTWRTLEPLHGMIYFVPEAAEAYARVGVTGRAGYFASRAAPMGAVPAEVVISTFFNFNPGSGARRHPGCMGGGYPGPVGGGAFRSGRRCLQRDFSGTLSCVPRRWTGPRCLARIAAEEAARRARRSPARGGSCRCAMAVRAAPRPLARAIRPARVPGRRAHCAAGRARAFGHRVARDPRCSRRHACASLAGDPRLVRRFLAGGNRRPTRARMAGARGSRSASPSGAPRSAGRSRTRRMTWPRRRMRRWETMRARSCAQLARPWSRVFAEHLG